MKALIDAKHEEWDASFTELARKYLVRPFQLLVNPIAFCMVMISKAAALE